MPSTCADSEGEGLGRHDAQPQPGKRAGTNGHSDQLNVGRFPTGLAQELLDRRTERAGAA